MTEKWLGGQAHHVACVNPACCTGAKWARINAAYGRFAPYRDASMDRWHRKTMLMTGTGAMRNNLRALNQSLSSQVCCCSAPDMPA